MRKAKNYRFREKMLCLALGCAIGITGAFFVSLPLEAKAASNTDIAAAATLLLNTTEMITFEGVDGEEYWYTFTVPEDIGNQWIEIAATNFTDSMYLYMRLYDCQGVEIYTYSGVSAQSTGIIRMWPEGSGHNGSVDGAFVPGETYYVKMSSNSCIGDVWLQAKAVPDDNWGTIEKAEKLKNDKTVKRELENSKDVDTYKIKCSKGQNYTLILSSAAGRDFDSINSAIEIYIYDSDGILLDSYNNYYYGNTILSKTLRFTGDGNTYYLSILGNTSGEYSLDFYKDPNVKKVKNVTLKSGKKLKLKWKKIKNADGYKIYYATSKNGDYRECYTIKKNSRTLSSSMTGHAYDYIKVQAYKTKHGVIYYGKMSKAIKIKWS